MRSSIAIPLEFANGPYSAKAIEMRTPGASHPGNHDLPVAFSYFLKVSGNKSGRWKLATVVDRIGSGRCARVAFGTAAGKIYRRAIPTKKLF